MQPFFYIKFYTLEKMKSILIILLAFSFLSSNAQDVMIYKDGSEKEAKILKINSNEVVFKKYSNLNGPEYTESKSNIFMIKYENGETDVFNNDIKKNMPETNFTLYSGTNIEIYLTHSISSKNIKNGDAIHFAVKNGITSNDGKQIIAANSYVMGRVASSEQAKAGGVKGELNIMVSTVTAVNGRNIPVFLNVANDGENKEGDAFVVGMLFFWPALFMKGGEAEIVAGTRFLVQTTQDVSFNTESLMEMKKEIPNTHHNNIINEINPCGDKPIAPPTYSNPQYRKSKEYKIYYRKLKEWENCSKY